MSYWQYFTRYIISVLMRIKSQKRGGSGGTLWCMSVGDGEPLFLDHHVASICKLCCTAKTPVRDTLDVWPRFPLVISDSTGLTEGVDNIVTALERRDRVHAIHLIQANSSAVENVLAVMQEPFPELTFLQLLSYGEPVPTVPDSFLGGSFPRLRFLVFPGLPKLHLSATHLLVLRLSNIPHSGYISPYAMVSALSTLICLQML